MKPDGRIVSRILLASVFLAGVAAGCDTPPEEDAESGSEAVAAGAEVIPEGVAGTEAGTVGVSESDIAGGETVDAPEKAEAVSEPNAAESAAAGPIWCPVYDCRNRGRHCALKPWKEGARMIGRTRTLFNFYGRAGEAAKMVMARSSWLGYRLHSQSLWYGNSGAGYLHIRGGSCKQGTYDYHSESTVQYWLQKPAGGLPYRAYSTQTSRATRASCGSEVGGAYYAWRSYQPC